MRMAKQHVSRSSSVVEVSAPSFLIVFPLTVYNIKMIWHDANFVRVI
jgi:hypothetical protein